MSTIVSAVVVGLDQIFNDGEGGYGIGAGVGVTSGGDVSLFAQTTVQGRPVGSVEIPIDTRSGGVVAPTPPGINGQPLLPDEPSDWETQRFESDGPVYFVKDVGLTPEEWAIGVARYQMYLELERTDSLVLRQLGRQEAEERNEAFFESLRQSARENRDRQERLWNSVGGAVFTFDELQDSPNVRLVRNPNKNLAAAIIPFAYSKGRDRWIADYEFEGVNYKVIFAQIGRPTGSGPPLAAVQAVRRALPGSFNDAYVAQEFFDKESEVFYRSSVLATQDAILLGLDAALLGQASVVRRSVTAAARASDAAPQAVRGIRTSTGLEVRGFAGHGVDRAIGDAAGRTGVTPQGILDALKNPLRVGPVRTDQLGRPSQRFIGQTGEVVVNPQTGRIISVNPTSSKKAERLLMQLGQ